MKTIKALSQLSKGVVAIDAVVESKLLSNKDRYLAEYEANEQLIASKKDIDRTPLPFIESLKRKVSKLVDSPDLELPIVARFDLYTGINKVSKRTPKDIGLNHLAHQLESTWHKDPLGTLTYGAVSALVSHYKDTYPRSKAADAIQAECTRVGLHKLPVAKLARLASNIESQDDFDTAMESNGYAGNRPEQIKARTFIRELVAMRGNKVGSNVDVVDNRTANERVTDHLAQLNMLPSETQEDIEIPKEDGTEQDFNADPLLDMNQDKIEEQDLEQGVDLVQEIQDVAEDIVESAPPEAQDYIQHEMSEGHSAPPGTAEWGAEEILNEGHESPPPTEEWLMEEMEEMGLDPMSMPLESNMPMEASSKEDKHTSKIHNLIAGYEDGKLKMTETEFRSALNKLVDDRSQSTKTAGMPLPTKIKSQPEVQTYNKEIGKDGGKVLKASEIENSVLDGKRVNFGPLSIHVNTNNEVELWNKDAGRVCDLIDLDSAIADFIILASNCIHERKANKIESVYAISPLITIPCENCANVTTFVKSGSQEDEYGCDCGYIISAESADILSKIGAQYQDYQVEVAYRPDPDPTKSKMQRDRISRAIMTTNGTANIHQDDRGYILATVSNTDEVNMDRLKRQLSALGAAATERRVASIITDWDKQAQLALPMTVEPQASLHELLNAHLLLARDSDTSPAQAIKEFLNKYSDRIDEDPSFPTMLADALKEHFSSSSSTAPAAMVDNPISMVDMGATMPMTAQTLKMPKVNKPKDYVDLGSRPLGQDMSQEEFSTPTNIKQEHAPQGKLPNTNLGQDSEGKDLLKATPTTNQHPNKPKGKSLPNKDLGHDTESSDPFKTPSLNKVPTVKK